VQCAVCSVQCSVRALPHLRPGPWHAGPPLSLGLFTLVTFVAHCGAQLFPDMEPTILELMKITRCDSALQGHMLCTVLTALVVLRLLACLGFDGEEMAVCCDRSGCNVWSCSEAPGTPS
jgi:hypothetical protein